MILQLNGALYAHGFSPWKMRFLREFTQRTDIRITTRIEQLPPDGTLLLWGAATPQGLPAGIKVIRFEDGFLRSVGLGADLSRPLSWVADSTGIHYDPSRPSDLEGILQETRFSAALLERADTLRRTIVDKGLTKYNTGRGRWKPPRHAQHVVLVAGQVESDASVRLGGGPIRTNKDLLVESRRMAPSAYIVYKPHPDVAAGLRLPGHEEYRCLDLCDEVVADASMSDLLPLVDEVHVMTSLAGFEALLRGVAVRCTGLPFYAGWGLTRDSRLCERRTRRISLEELIAGALILYPLYVTRSRGTPASAEQALDDLIAWKTKWGAEHLQWGRWIRAFNRLRAR